MRCGLSTLPWGQRGLIVSAFMWPHGAAAMVRRKIAKVLTMQDRSSVGIRTADPR